MEHQMVKYGDIEVGQLFKIPTRPTPWKQEEYIYMKISSENDHNYRFVTISPKIARGSVSSGLLDDEPVYPIQIDEIKFS